MMQLTLALVGLGLAMVGGACTTVAAFNPLHSTQLFLIGTGFSLAGMAVCMFSLYR